MHRHLEIVTRRKMATLFYRDDTTSGIDIPPRQDTPPIGGDRMSVAVKTQATV